MGLDFLLLDVAGCCCSLEGAGSSAELDLSRTGTAHSSQLPLRDEVAISCTPEWSGTFLYLTARFSSQLRIHRWT